MAIVLKMKLCSCSGLLRAMNGQTCEAGAGAYSLYEDNYWFRNNSIEIIGAGGDISANHWGGLSLRNVLFLQQ